MNRRSWKYVLVALVVAVAVSTAAPQANAHLWGGCHGGCGYYGSYWGYSYTPWCGSCYSSCGGWGYGYCGGHYRGCGCHSRWYNGCCTYSYTPCCGGWTTTSGCGCSDAAPSTPTPAHPTLAPTPAKKPVEPPPALPNEPAAPAPAPGLPGPNAPLPGMPKTTATSSDTSGLLTVWVPFDAKVMINGLETRSTGSRREFVSYGLKAGLSYKYVVRATVVREGKTLEDSQTVTLTAGQIEAVAFGFNTTPAEQVATR
jgi:uncharacterized protein (TIGR03000 family)